MSEPKKPLLMRRDEFIYDLERVLNGHDLPAVMMQPIVADYLRSIEDAMKRQYAEDEQEYRKACEAAKDAEDAENAKANMDSAVSGEVADG